MKTIPIHPISSQSITPTNKPISLIIKVTEKCNFKCTFCSSTNITEDKAKTLDINLIFDFLKRYPNTDTIIVNGGDPLMVRIDYYWQLIDYLDKNNLKTKISFTSNLWPFYINPDKWTPLFKHPRMGVATSFQYGEGRRVDENTVYTEELFWKVSDLFLERVGYRPDFISVVTEEDLDKAIDNVRLAKKMNVNCKLNPVHASGIASKPLPLSFIYKLYLQIYKEDLWQWEYNTLAMMKHLTKPEHICPLARSCDEGIRVLQPSGDYYSCGAFADDFDYPISFQEEIYNNKFFTPLQDDTSIFSMKVDCITCDMFSFCNGCRKTVKEHQQHNLVDTHCKTMKSISDEIKAINSNNQRRIQLSNLSIK